MSSREVSHRMRLGHPDAFQPRVILFSDYPSENQTDWIDCFTLKAAAVYSAVVGRDVDDNDNMSTDLLVSLAEYLWRHPTTSSSVQGAPKKQGDDILSTLGTDILPIEATHNQGSQAAQPAVLEKSSSDADGHDETKILLQVIERLPKEMKQRIDAVYLVVGFLRDISGLEDRHRLDRYALFKHGHDIITDLAMLENQVPLQLLLDVATNIRHALTWYKENFLMISKNNNLIIISRIDKFGISSSMDELISHFCWYYSPFFSTKRKVFGKRKWEKERHLLGCLHSTLVPGGTSTSTSTSRAAGTINNIATKSSSWVTPTATELTRAGIRFEPDTTTGEARIGFSRTGVLRVPVLFFDSKLETVTLNLMAMERKPISTVSTRRSCKPITRYFQFLNELVDDLGDVKLLIKSGIVRGRWRKEQDVLDLVKRVDGFASYSSAYPPMDVAIEEMKEFYKKHTGKFTVRHKPAIALFVSSVAAASILLAAALSITSEKKPSSKK